MKKPAMFVRGYFVSRKWYILVDKDNNVLFKAKGVNWGVGRTMTNADKLRILEALDELMPAALARLGDKPTPTPKLTLGLQIRCNRWIWNHLKTAVVI